MKNIDRDDAAKICDARDTLCSYCTRRACVSCPVTDIVNEALSSSEDDD